MICRFEGEYRFLSNFFPSRIRYKNQTYRTAEHAFQAAKALYPEEAFAIKKAVAPGVAKKLGRQVIMREDWEEIKIPVMREILEIKFSDPVLAQMLKDTGDEELVEGNHWGDTFWGVCRGRGYNHLGKILMNIRSDISS